jgi:hypothetical protein
VATLVGSAFGPSSDATDVIAYAGILLITSEGHVPDVLRLRFTGARLDERGILQILATSALSEIELRLVGELEP